MINDITSDSPTRTRDTGVRKLKTIKLLYSKVVGTLVGIFQAKGYIKSFNIVEEDKKKFIDVVLRYDEKGKSVINELKRVSKPGCRVYKDREEIKRFKNGYGAIVVNTSRSVLANDKAYKAGVGGEILCTV